jgi:hypothetical protein
MYGEVVGDSQLLDMIFRCIREEFDRQYRINDPEDTDPDTVAFQKAVHGMRCPVTALVVRLPKRISFWSNIECDRVSYVRLDLEKQGISGWEFLGEFASDDILKRRDLANALLLQEPSPEYLESLANGTTGGASERSPEWLMLGVAGDIREVSTVDAWLAVETLMFDFQDGIVRRAGTKLDFHRDYHLHPPPLPSLEKLLQTHEMGRTIVPKVDPADFKPLLERAERVNSILLIPKVPHEVAITFEIARQLHVYSSFQHLLGTAAHHYLFLAIEAAVKHRWTATLPDPVEVTNKVGGKILLSKPRHQECFEIQAKQNGDKAWHFGKLKVNGRAFIPKIDDLVDELCSARLLSKWQQRRLKAGIRMRNHFSHREFSIIMPAGEDRFRDIAKDINHLFHSA